MKGQAVLESVLMMFVVIAIWIVVSTSLKKAQFFNRIFGESWTRLSNTMEFGIPANSKQQASPEHPTSYSRHSTLLNEKGP